MTRNWPGALIFLRFVFVILIYIIICFQKPEFKNAYTQVLSIVPSQNGRHVTLFTDSGFLWIGSSDFKNKYCEIDTGYIKQPKELVWYENTTSFMQN